MLPHLVFNCLHTQYPNAFTELLVGQPGGMQSFWNAMEGTPMMTEHPVLTIENYNQCMVPLCLHGDGVPITGVGKSWSVSMDVFSFHQHTLCWQDSGELSVICILFV